jgi:hypothetical protein
MKRYYNCFERSKETNILIGKEVFRVFERRETKERERGERIVFAFVYWKETQGVFFSK